MTPAGVALLNAWRAWDAAPKAEHTVRAMESACHNFVDDESTLVLRRYLAAARRRGTSREDAITTWETLHGST